MPHILVIGLPKGASHLVDSFAKGAGLLVDRVYALPGKEGTLILLPRPEHCLPAIRRYLDASGQGAADYAGSHIVVLPYASVPQECLDELDVLSTMGAKVDFPDPATDASWPKLSRRKRPDHDFHVALAKRLQQHLSSLVPAQSEAPSDFIRQLARESGVLLIADGALDSCDMAAPHRHDFIRKAVTAMTDAVLNGLHGRFDAHCSDRGLQHAQSGGSIFSVSILDCDATVNEYVSQTHLKQGDKTTREAAARVYYTFVDHKDERYVALLYAGPHPDGNHTCRVRLPGGSEPQ